jgi:hypothetical protein
MNVGRLRFSVGQLLGAVALLIVGLAGFGWMLSCAHGDSLLIGSFAFLGASCGASIGVILQRPFAFAIIGAIFGFFSLCVFLLIALFFFTGHF